MNEQKGLFILILAMLVTLCIGFVTYEKKNSKSNVEFNEQMKSYQSERIHQQEVIDSLQAYADSCMFLANKLAANRAASDSLLQINLRKYEKQSRILDTCGVDDLLKFLLQPK